MSHPKIASAPEPWFLLPLFHLGRPAKASAPYGHAQSVLSFRRITSECGQHYIDSRVRDFALDVYACYCKNNEMFFLDKTPRYYHILDDLARCFTNAKFIVLLRNPISVFASSLQAFRHGTVRRLDHLRSDFTTGPQNLGDFAQRNAHNVFTLTYENLISEPVRHIREVVDYIGLEYDPEMIHRSFDIRLDGHGDHIGARKYKNVTDTTEKWRAVITTPMRKARLLKFLKEYPEAYLRAGKYDRNHLIGTISSLKTKCIQPIEYVYSIEETTISLCKKLHSLYSPCS